MVLGSCITQFMPETGENKDILVVEGLITDQLGTNIVKLSRSLPLAGKKIIKPVRGYNVTISDDEGNSHLLSEKEPGTYITDSATFRGIVGRKYKLIIRANNIGAPNYTYESLPMEMKPVPPIDSIYFEKVIIETGTAWKKNGCQIYLDTHDPENKCKYYRWDYTETWEFRLPYYVTNNRCWISERSNVINIKSTNVLSASNIVQYPLKYISPETDRLSVKYSLLVNQYSLNEDEYDFWSKIQNISQDVGSLYDITPASIPGNIFCIEDPGETVLGYFSVSSVNSKRIHIKESFLGLVNLYYQCPTDTVHSLEEIEDVLNTKYWIIEDGSYDIPPYWVITNKKGCADCTVRGTNIKPSWWE